LTAGAQVAWHDAAMDYTQIAVERVDEIVVLRLDRPEVALAIGDKVRLIPGHCDPTVNLHDWFVGVRNGRVESLWPVSGRGPGF
jgi:D-serine deaminase-like pyridoxal phosphate-dependent protein